MVISRTTHASRDLSRSAQVFATFSAEGRGPAGALMSAERVQCHVAKLLAAACRQSALTRLRHLHRSCRLHPGLPTRDITCNQTTRRGPTRHMPLALSAVLVCQQWDLHLYLTIDDALLTLLFFHHDSGDRLKTKTCHYGYCWQLCWTDILFPLLLIVPYLYHNFCFFSWI